ncbi:MAG: group II intron reverse transcriptase/maturase [Pseudomonadota bacterium]
MKDGQSEDTPVTVSETTRRTGETPATTRRTRWWWVEPRIWTDHMLTALENGVKGGKWYSLMDKVCCLANLRAAFGRVRVNGGSAGVDRQSISMFEKDMDKYLDNLSKSLRDGNYHPHPIKRVWIPKPGSKEKRPLGIPTVRDRVVQTALRNVLEPIFERDFAEQSYGFRPGRSCKDALRRVQDLLNQGYVHVVDADLKSYFDTIPHKSLMELIKVKIADTQVVGLLEAYLKQRVMDTAEGWTPERGTPQGAVMSPLLSNIYLDGLDHYMESLDFQMVRYADDFVVMCKSAEEAAQALGVIQGWTARAGLTLHPDKTRIVDATQRGGFDFLGYHFERGYRWPRKKSLGKLKDTIRALTRRTSGLSLRMIISMVSAALVGWFGYFKHSHKTTFDRIDKWVRMRLRSILRKRNKRRGRGRGLDHNRWPNVFFAGQGLFSLTSAHAAASQSARR